MEDRASNWNFYYRFTFGFMSGVDDTFLVHEDFQPKSSILMLCIQIMFAMPLTRFVA